MVGHERARLAALIPIRVEHEVLDDELVLVLKELAQRHAPIGSLEGVCLFQPHPRQSLASTGQFVTRVGVSLFLLKQFKARFEPATS